MKHNKLILKLHDNMVIIIKLVLYYNVDLFHYESYIYVNNTLLITKN